MSENRIRIILSVINDLVGDQRMHRIASSLQEAGYEVLLVGRRYADSLPLPDRPYQTHRMRLWFRKGKCFYLEYNLRLLFLLLFQRVDIITANDLDTLLASYLAAKWRNKRLIYDSHEYFTEVPELVRRPLTRALWLRLERWIFPKLTTVYTVNSSLARIYQSLYGVEVEVVRNVPFRRKEVVKAPPGSVLLYQGSLNIGRGIELMIEAMTHLPEYQLWIVGRGDIEPELRAQARQLSLQDRVLFHGFVPLEELAQITSQAILGFSLEEDLGDNYRYASPNKVYDYIQAGVPVLVSDLPEMRRIVEQYGVGEIMETSNRTPLILAKRIRHLLSHPNQLTQYRQKCSLAAKVLNWEKEKSLLLNIYQG